MSKSIFIRFGRMEGDQFQAVEFDRHAAVFAEGFEVVAGFGVGVPGHDGVAIFEALLDLFPDEFAQAARGMADIDAGADFYEPDPEPAAQPGWDVFSDDDQHRQGPFRR